MPAFKSKVLFFFCACHPPSLAHFVPSVMSPGNRHRRLFPGRGLRNETTGWWHLNKDEGTLAKLGCGDKWFNPRATSQVWSCQSSWKMGTTYRIKAPVNPERVDWMAGLNLFLCGAVRLKKKKNNHWWNCCDGHFWQRQKFVSKSWGHSGSRCRTLIKFSAGFWNNWRDGFIFKQPN